MCMLSWQRTEPAKEDSSQLLASDFRDETLSANLLVPPPAAVVRLYIPHQPSLADPTATSWMA